MKNSQIWVICFQFLFVGFHPWQLFDCFLQFLNFRFKLAFFLIESLNIRCKLSLFICSSRHGFRKCFALTFQIINLFFISFHFGGLTFVIFFVLVIFSLFFLIFLLFSIVARTGLNLFFFILLFLKFTFQSFYLFFCRFQRLVEWRIFLVQFFKCWFQVLGVFGRFLNRTRSGILFLSLIFNLLYFLLELINLLI